MFGMLGVLVIIAVLLAVNLNRPVEFKPTVNVQAQADPQRNTMSVSGNAQMSVAPDRAIVYISVITEDNKTANGAHTTNRDTSNAVVAALKGSGVNASDIETDTYSLEKITNWDTEKSKYMEYGYRLTHTMKVTSAKIAEAGDLIDVAVGAGANGVPSVTFDLSKELEKKVRDDALVRATEAAKEKAQRLAKSAGVNLGKVINVQEQNFYYAPYEFNTKNSVGGMAMDATPTQISPQKVEVTSSVSLQYELN
jgi:uncharacterized protein